MGSHTIEDVEEKMDASLAWRRAELQALQGQIEKLSSSPGSPAQRAMARAGVAMAYAHWEGFFRDACQAYLEYVSRRRMTYAELNDGFALSSFWALVRRAQSGNVEAQTDLLSLVRGSSGTRARLPKDLVDTESNLRSRVAEKILLSLGLDASWFQLRAPMIDARLCDARNEIAHGRDVFPSTEEFGQLRGETLLMMETLRTAISNALQLRAYRDLVP